MATVTNEQTRSEAPPVPPPVAGPMAGNPAILGLPIFVVGSLALGFSLVGYVPAAAGGVIVPVIFAGTGVGLVISTVWAAALGQTLPACIFGLFAGFWMSFAVLVLGLDHNWLLVPTASVVHGVGLFLISWTIVFAFLTVALRRLPLAFPLLVALVVLALVLRTIGVLDASNTASTLAGIVVFIFAALGGYLFLGVADTASGGPGLPLGQPLLK